MSFKKKIIKVCVFFIFIYFIFALNVKADIYDDAETLNYTDRMEISALCKKYEQTSGMNILIYTFNGTHGNNISYEAAEDFIDVDVENWYDSIFPSLNCSTKKDTIIFAIDMNSRTTVIVGYDGLSNIDFSGNDSIVLDTTDFLRDGNYYKAFEFFIRNCQSAIMMKYLKRFLISFAISIIISIIICFSLVFKSKGSKTISFKTYLTDKSRLVNKSDIYLRTDVRRVKRESSSSRGHSSGGHSHGGGGHGHF